MTTIEELLKERDNLLLVPHNMSHENINKFMELTKKILDIGNNKDALKMNQYEELNKKFKISEDAIWAELRLYMSRQSSLNIRLTSIENKTDIIDGYMQPLLDHKTKQEIINEYGRPKIVCCMCSKLHTNI